MSFLQHAMDLADKGFHVFPLRPNSKLPLISNFPTVATRDKEQIKKWWLDPVMGIEQPYNIGISTSKFKDDHALVVVDVDNKGTKKGDDALFELEMKGHDIPCTFTQVTPTGGRHLVYSYSMGVRQGVNVLGNGLDIRSNGGYIVGAGSTLEGKEYTIEHDCPSSKAPQWLIDVCGKILEKKRESLKVDINRDQAIQRAIDFLENSAEISIEGEGGDQTAFRVAAKVKDFGVDQTDCLELMVNHWNARCIPQWDPKELTVKIENAYQYGNTPIGANAPESQFQKITGPTPEEKLSFLQEMNKTFALVYTDGSHSIIQETVDEKGRMKRTFHTEQTFKRMFSPYPLEKGGTYATEWLNWIGRREYAGICFAPEREARNGYYNMWSGFTCKPLPYAEANAEQRKGLDMFLEHALENIARGDKELFTWLIGYLAHMIQKPFERPLTTVVFRGAKGVGKNALIDRVGNLLGSNQYLVAHDSRYLTSNFNGHLDSCLCLVLDEAFWSGDKSAEGKLKGITTSKEILIERKGREPYMIDNLVRLIIIGNDRWLVPASFDERRYSVYDVGDGKKQNMRYFSEMRELLDEKDGCRVLLDYLQKFDLSKVDVNKAPRTQALFDQKLSSLEPFEQWWFSCLSRGYIAGEFGPQWEEQLDKEVLRVAFFQYCKSLQIRSRLPDEMAVGRLLASFLPSLIKNQKRREGKGFVYVYRFPPLEDARKEWESYVGQKIEWD